MIGLSIYTFKNNSFITELIKQSQDDENKLNVIRENEDMRFHNKFIFQIVPNFIFDHLLFKKVPKMVDND